MRWLSSTLVMMLVTTVFAGARPEVDTLRIRPHVHVQGSQATLGDVLICAQADPDLWSIVDEAPLVTDLSPSATTTITHAQIERRLEELGVNPARVLLSGAAACQITLRPPVETSAPQPVAATSQSAPADATRTLAQLLREYVNADVADLGGTAEIEFERAGTPFLDLTTPPWEFSIRTRGREKLGLREFRVVLQRDGKTQRTASLFAQVQLSKAALVAREPLNVGAVVAQQAVGLEPRLFERVEDVGLDRIEEAVGQRVGRFVPAGQMVRRGDLKSVELVGRARPVTVINAGNNVHVRLSGVSLDSGGYGETVRVRLGDSRRDRRVLRGVVTGLGTVQVEEAQP